MPSVLAALRRRWFCLALGLAGLGLSLPAVRANDLTWDNGAANLQWNTTSANWTGSVWSNGGDAAIFGGLGQGTINLANPISFRSIDVSAGSNYTLTGPGGLTVVSTGSGTLAPSTIQVGTGATLAINTPLVSSIGLYKNGEGLLQLGAPVSFPAPGTTPILNGAVNLQIGLPNPGDQFLAGFPIGGAGTVELTAANVLPTTTSVAMGNGWLNIGNFNTTLGQLIYMNTVASGPYGVNGNNGVYSSGTGTLKVTGPIIVQANLGQSTGSSNTLAANLDMNGGTQQFFTNTLQTALGYTALHVTGVLSNGSLLKTWNQGQPGGIGLYANNTYTGSTTINGSVTGPATFTTTSFHNVVAGTNASTELNAVNGVLILYGANGSYGSAANVNVIGGATLSLDNNSATTGTNGPAVASGNNQDRLNDTAAVTLAGSTLQLISASTGASTETIGSLTAANGFNTVRATATAGNVAAWDVDGAFTQSAGATTLFAGTTLGTSSIIKFGSTPATTGGIIDRAYGSNSAPAEVGFVEYDATAGVRLLTSYDATFGLGSSSNVSIAASPAAIGTQTINSLRTTANATLSFNPGATLNIASGQILTTTGTLTIDATTPTGTLAFGSNPGVFHVHAGTVNVNSPMTGSGGIIKSGNGTLNINASSSLANMAGNLVHNSGTTSLFADYAGNIDVLSGTFNLRTNLTTPGATITLGNPLTPSNTVGTSAGLNLASTTVTTINRNLVVSNGTTPTLTSFPVLISQQGGSAGIVQEISGSVTLNGPLNISGGGNTINVLRFSGALTGTGSLRLQNGNIQFTSTSTNYGGQFILGNGGNTSVVNFDGVNSSSTGTTLIGAGTGLVASTRVRLNSANAIAGGDITMQGGTLTLKNSMTLPNNIILNFDNGVIAAAIETLPGTTSNLTGVLSSTNAGSNLQKLGTGTLILSNPGNTLNAIVNVNAGTLLVNGLLPSSTSDVNVNATAALGGTGTVARDVNIVANGTLAPGASPGTLTIDGDVTFSSGSNFNVELNGTTPGTYDVLNVIGAGQVVTLGGATLNATSTFTNFLPTDRLFVLTLDNASSSLAGTFNGIAQDGFVAIAGVSGGSNWLAQVSYTGDSTTQSLTGGNDVVLYNISAVPEPGTLALIGIALAGGVGGWRYRRFQGQHRRRLKS